MVVLIILIGGLLAIFLLPAMIGAPYIPTHRHQAVQAFKELRPLDKNDLLIDIGSGDGAVLNAAMQTGSGRAIGYEINPLLVMISRWRLRKYDGRARVFWRNFWHVNPPHNMSVVYTFGESRDIKKMHNLAQKWANQTGQNIDFVSYAFTVPGHVPTKTKQAHHLYKITPLQLSKT